MPATAVDRLAAAMAACRICRDAPRGERLPHEPRPVFRISARARVLVASQAPGLRAHTSGVPFDDASGRRLRSWMGVGSDVFYDADQVAIVPMGFCFPGYDAAKGDRPPRPECRARWHDDIFALLPQVELILAIGTHAIRYHLDRLGLITERSPKMSDLVQRWHRLTADRPLRLIPLPHPSWRNTGWLNRNPWFEATILPEVQAEVRRLTADLGNAQVPDRADTRR